MNPTTAASLMNVHTNEDTANKFGCIYILFFSHKKKFRSYFISNYININLKCKNIYVGIPDKIDWIFGYKVNFNKKES